MNDTPNSSDSLMDASGMGLLPGIALAFFLSLAVMAALVLAEWWVMAVVLVTLILVAAAVVAVVWIVASDDDDEDDTWRRRVPGLAPRARPRAR